MTKSTRRYFDRMAGQWGKGARTGDLGRLLEPLVARFGIPWGGRVLDVGTGTGVLQPYLIAAVGERGQVLAFDFSGCMLAEAMKISRPENLVCFQADVTAIPLTDETCDSVVCFAAFPHFERKQQALHEMARVARRGGRVIIAHLMDRRQIARHHDANPDVAGHYLPPAERMRRLFSDAGLHLVEIEEKPGLYLAMAEKKARAGSG